MLIWMESCRHLKLNTCKSKDILSFHEMASLCEFLVQVMVPSSKQHLNQKLRVIMTSSSHFLVIMSCPLNIFPMCLFLIHTALLVQAFILYGLVAEGSLQIIFLLAVSPGLILSLHGHQSGEYKRIEPFSGLLMSLIKA